MSVSLRPLDTPAIIGSLRSPALKALSAFTR